MNSNRYGKFFVSCFVIVALIAVFRWLLLWNVPFSYMDGEYAIWSQKKDYANAKGVNQEILFLGDSRIMSGVCPNQICENAYNLAVGGGTAVEMYYLLEAYLREHINPQKVFLGFSAAHYEEEDHLRNRTFYFHFFPLHMGVKLCFLGYKLGMLSLTELKDEIRDMVKYYLFFPQKYSAACINSRFERKETNCMQYRKIVATKGQVFRGMNKCNNNLNEEARKLHFVPHLRINLYIKNIIELCKKERIPLFIIQLPMNEASWNKINETNYYKEFKEYLLGLAEQTYAQIETEIPCYASDCFGDSSHLNPLGAQRFTAEIKAKYGL